MLKLIFLFALNNIKIDVENDYLVKEYYYDTLLIGVSYLSFRNFSDSLLYSSFREALVDRWRAELKSLPRISGLQISLPLQLPSPIVGIIGQGGNLKVERGLVKVDMGLQGTKPFGEKLSEYSKMTTNMWMDHDMQLRARGTIGQKIHTDISYDAKREFTWQNMVKIRYEGLEHEIIKTINGGDIKPSQLYGPKVMGNLALGMGGMFGLQSKMQFGPLDLWIFYALERSELKTEKFTGKARIDSVLLYDYQFTKDKFFLLKPNEQISSNFTIIDCRVFTTSYYPEDVTYPAILVDWSKKGEKDEKLMMVKEMEKEEYELLPSNVGEILYLKTSLSSSDWLAVTYIYQDGSKIDTVGSFYPVRDTFTNLIVIRRDRSTNYVDYISWEYELKNIYQFSTEPVEERNFDVEVYKIIRTEAGQESLKVRDENGIKYRELLGIGDENAVKIEYVNFDYGFLYFPDFKPFEKLSPPDTIYNIQDFTDFEPTYAIKIKFQPKEVKKIRLKNVPVEDSSETVILNGRELKRGKDYSIDYETGEIVIYDKEAMSPNAEIKVTYRYKQFIQIGAKQLFIIQGVSRTGDFGFTLLSQTAPPLELKPKFYSAPFRLFGTEMFFKKKFTASFADMEISMQGGYTFYNPNTRGAGYIDDMDAGLIKDRINLFYRKWICGSVPGKRLWNFAQVIWYNPKKEKEKPLYKWFYPGYYGGETRTPLCIVLPDTITEKWRYDDNYDYHWTSLLTCISTAGEDYKEATYIEFWAKSNCDAIMHIDVGGEISEDIVRRDASGRLIPPNNKLDTEDKNENRMLDAGEDVGLDGVAGNDADFNPDLPDSIRDDGNDDFSEKEGYLRINGTERNKEIDSEDLDKDRVLDGKEPSYFSFKLKLNKNYLKESHGWKLYRVPLKEADSVGKPTWRCIKFLRIWFDSLKPGDKIEIVEFSIVTPKWVNLGIFPSDSLGGEFEIDAVTTEEDTLYRPPEGIEGTRETGVIGMGREVEGSLILRARNLLPGHKGVARLRFNNPRDLMDYNEARVYVKGNRGRLVIKFCTGENDWYAYTRKVQNDWNEPWVIPLDSFPRLKSVEKDTSGNFIKKGNPSLSQIKFMELELLNDETEPIDAEVYVNELTLVSPRVRKGKIIQTTLKLNMFKNLIGVTAKYTDNSADFSKIGSKPAHIAKREIEIAPTLKIPVRGKEITTRFNYKKSVKIPTYLPKSDIKIPLKERKKYKTDIDSKFFSITQPFSLPIFNISRADLRRSFTEERNGYKFSYSYSLSGSVLSFKLPFMKSRGLSYSYSYVLDKNKGEKFKRTVKQEIKVSNIPSLGFSLKFPSLGDKKASFSARYSPDIPSPINLRVRPRQYEEWGRIIKWWIPDTKEDLAINLSVPVFTLIRLSPSLNISLTLKRRATIPNVDTVVKDIENPVARINKNVNWKADIYFDVFKVMKWIPFAGEFIEKHLSWNGVSFELSRRKEFREIDGLIAFPLKADKKWWIFKFHPFKDEIPYDYDTINFPQRKKRAIRVKGFEFKKWLIFNRLSFTYDYSQEISKTRANLSPTKIITHNFSIDVGLNDSYFQILSKYLPMVERISLSGISLGYLIKRTRETEKKERVEKTFTTGVSPRIRFIKSIEVDFSFNYSLEKGEFSSYGMVNRTKGYDFNFRFSTRRTLDTRKGIHLPFFGYIRLKNVVNLTLSGEYTLSRKYQLRGGEEAEKNSLTKGGSDLNNNSKMKWTVMEDRKTAGVDLKLNYRINRQLTGAGIFEINYFKGRNEGRLDFKVGFGAEVNFR